MGVLAGWSYRKAIFIQGDQVDASLTGFPVLVKITADAGVAAHALASGADFRFTASDGTTLLPFERESYASGTGVFWLKTNVPTVIGTTIYLYYGNSAAADASDPATVWSGYAGVFHLNESSGSAANATGGTAGTFYGNLPNQQAGKINGAQYFDGTDYTYDWIQCGAVGDTSTSITLSAWVKWADLPSALCTIFSRRDSGCNWGLRKTKDSFDHGNSNNNLTFVHLNGSWRLFHTTDANLQANTWYRVMATYDGQSNPKIYLNGTLLSGYWDTSQAWYSAGPAALISTPSDPTTIGGRQDPSEPDTHYGWIDQAEIFVGVRSAAWAKFDYYNQASADNELLIGNEESLATPGGLSHTSTGGLILGGSSTHRLIRSHASTGGLILGGSSTVVHPSAPGGLSHTSTGGLILGGSASRPNVRTHASAGGLVLGGGIVYPSPCAAAATVCGGVEFGAVQVLQLTTDGSFGVDPAGAITTNLSAIRIGYRDGGGL